MEMKGRNQHKWELYQRAEASIIAVISYFSTIPVVVPTAVFHVGLLPSLYLSRAVHPVCLCEALFSATGHIQPRITAQRPHQTPSASTERGKATGHQTAAGGDGGIKMLKRTVDIQRPACFCRQETF